MIQPRFIHWNGNALGNEEEQQEKQRVNELVVWAATFGYHYFTQIYFNVFA